MSKFYVERKWALHEGGTKYYQAFLITKDDFRPGAVVTHWGSFHDGADKAPRNHGQRKVEFHERGASSAYRKIISMKSSRGYNSWEDKNAVFHNEGEFHTWLEATMKSSDVNGIAEYFNLDIVGIEAEGLMNAEDREAENEYLELLASRAQPSLGQSESWGSW